MADSDHSSNIDMCADTTTGQDHGKNNKPEFSEDEQRLIQRMFNLLGDRWSLIAGRIPGRTAEEIEKYCTSRHSASR